LASFFKLIGAPVQEASTLAHSENRIFVQRHFKVIFKSFVVEVVVLAIKVIIVSAASKQISFYQVLWFRFC